MRSPTFVDSHAHLTDPAFAPDLPAVLGRARAAGVVAFVVVGYDLASSEMAIEFAAKHRDVWATVGIHPNHTDIVANDSYRRLEQLARGPRVVAVGECGLDFFRNRTTPDRQRAAFTTQLAIADSLSLPVVVHSRAAMAETLDLLRSTPLRRGGVLHCFDGTVYDAARAVSAGLWVSVAGPITYRKDPTLGEAIASVPQDRLLLETDCPYLGPIGFRGERNEPARVALVAEAVARLRGVTVERIGAETTVAAAVLFGIEASL
jgi:TatD DNase family protein